MARRKTGNVLSEDVEEARKQIMVAAEKVFQRYGVSKTTMDDIGREAGGVSRPTVYRYFGDRDTLISAIIERRSRMLFAKARKFLLEKDSFADQLVEGLIFLVDRGTPRSADPHPGQSRTHADGRTPPRRSVGGLPPG